MSKPHNIKLSKHERQEYEQLTRTQKKRYKNLRESEITHVLAMLYVKDSA